MEASLWCFALAAISDGLDGWIAKRFNMQTTLGAVLDPVADKLMLVTGFITLTLMSKIPLWLTLMVVTRDVVIIGGALIFQVVNGTLQIKPLAISKWNTLMQICVILAVMIWEVYGVLDTLLPILIWGTAATTIISGLIYIWEWTQRNIVKEPASIPSNRR